MHIYNKLRKMRYLLKFEMRVLFSSLKKNTISCSCSHAHCLLSWHRPGLVVTHAAPVAVGGENPTELCDWCLRGIMGGVYHLPGRNNWQFLVCLSNESFWSQGCTLRIGNTKYGLLSLLLFNLNIEIDERKFCREFGLFFILRNRLSGSMWPESVRA